MTNSKFDDENDLMLVSIMGQNSIFWDYHHPAGLVPFFDPLPGLPRLDGTISQMKIIPIAHRVVFEELEDGILVLDLQDCVIDLNNAAMKIIALPFRKLFGLPLKEAMPALSEKIEGQDGAHPGRQGASDFYGPPPNSGSQPAQPRRRRAAQRRGLGSLEHLRPQQPGQNGRRQRGAGSRLDPARRSPARSGHPGREFDD